MTELEPPYPLIRRAFDEGRVIPFLGSGASLAGRPADYVWAKTAGDFLPTTKELVDHFVHELLFPAADESPALETVAQYYDVSVGRESLNRELHEIFDTDYNLGSLHRFLAAAPAPLLIVTTNYDDLIERAFRTAKRPFHLVVHSVGRPAVLVRRAGEAALEYEARNKLDLDLDQNPMSVIFKMHGAVDRSDATRDQFVITEDDYVDFLTVATKGTPVPALLAQLFQGRHFLFLGYGLRDWNFRVVLNRVDRYLSPKPIRSWAIDRNPSALEELLWQRRNVQVFKLTIDEFVTKLQEP